MGGEFVSHSINAKDAAEAIEKAQKYQEDSCYEYGHGEYSGHLGTAGIGVQLLSESFPTEEAAEKHIQNTHDKWDLPMLVRLKDTEDGWLLAGWCSS